MKEEAVVQGYIDLLKEVGRSVKKNPPTILALIKNIQSRGFLPTINSVIEDVYKRQLRYTQEHLHSDHGPSGLQLVQ